jgi:hypothetical protein
LLATVSVLIITCLNAGSRAVAAELAGCPAVGTHAAITLCDNDLSILDSETTGICIRQRRAIHEEQHAQSHETFHREPPAWQANEVTITNFNYGPALQSRKSTFYLSSGAIDSAGQDSGVDRRFQI